MTKPIQNNNMIIGLDIGGTKINAILFDAKKKKIIRQIKKATPQNKKDFLLMVFDIINNLRSRANKIQGIGLGIAGALDLKKGQIIHNINMPFLDNLPLREIIEDEFNLLTRLDNDARCFLRGEAMFGAVKGYNQAVGLTLGTGVGGGLLINGQIITGAYDSAGELGHMIIKCPMSGDRGRGLSLESLISQKGIKKLTNQTSQELLLQAKNGQVSAIKIFNEIGFYLGIGLANLVNILDPEIIVIGGGLAKVGKFILGPAREIMEKLIFSPKAKKVKIVLTKLGDKAGALGAASLLLTRV